MGWRFRSSVKLLPGVRLNFGKSGISTSLGGRGATLNIGSKGTRSTFGIPGSGISYSTLHTGGGDAASGGTGPSGTAQGCGCWVVIGILGLLFLVARCGSSDAPVEDNQTPSNRTATSTSMTPATAYVTASTLNARALPSASAPVLQKLGRGEKLDVTERAGEWVKIVRSGVTMWVAAKHLSDQFVPDSATTPPISLIGRSAITPPSTSGRSASGGSCPCSSRQVCIGPRGGRYCITAGGNKRYGI